ncbi:hypothetical protein BZG21_47145, partial [Escherichia coli]|nr:hypothetical protein [Escherichia coli]
IEDLFPVVLISDIVTRMLPRPADLDEDFLDIVQSGIPIVQQIENYASKNSIDLQKGWKVELAQRVKSQLLKERVANQIDDPTMELWGKIFREVLEP